MSESELGISLVRDDLLFRIQRRIGLIPSRGLGIVRRAIFFALLAWLPIAVWAAYTGRALSGGPVADTLSLYEAVTKMRAAPIGKAALLTMALPAALPMLALFAIEVPIKEPAAQDRRGFGLARSPDETRWTNRQ